MTNLIWSRAKYSSYRLSSRHSCTERYWNMIRPLEVYVCLKQPMLGTTDISLSCLSALEVHEDLCSLPSFFLSKSTYPLFLSGCSHTPFTLCLNSCRGSPSVIGSNVAHNWPVSSSCIMPARHSLCSKIYKGLWAKPQTSVHRLREVYWYIFRALNNFCFLLCWWKGVALYIEYSVCWRFHLDK